jgi:hypothetical protein
VFDAADESGLFIELMEYPVHLLERDNELDGISPKPTPNLMKRSSTTSRVAPRR